MIRQDIQEDLVSLFLRLNGYFTTGLVLHSPELGKNKTELDLVAIRFPFHNQHERIVGCSDYLQIPPNTIDIIIGEVKSGKEQSQFNTALREDRATLEALINWVGAFDENETQTITDALLNLLVPELINNPENFKCLIFKGKSGHYSIRPLIFSIDRPEPRRNQPRYISRQLMLDYIWSCLRPESIRPSCSTIYNYNMWGHTLLALVEYFKNENKTAVGNMQELYAYYSL